jgi:glycerol-3-phosphate acyltransferase PlsX
MTDDAEKPGLPVSVDEFSAPAKTNTIISIDAMSGDRGAGAVMAGMAYSAKVNPDISFIVHGDEEELRRLLRRRPLLAARCEIRHAPDVVGMEAKPSRIMRNARGTSMLGALESVAAKEARVAVSCGNTGALMALAMLKLRRAPGVDRPAIAVFFPSRNKSGHNIFLDVGADIRAEPENLLQYAIMGAEYARVGLGLAKPRVGLLNVGSEEHKGRPSLHAAAELIAAAAIQPGADFAYIGFVEGSDLPADSVDVIVTDGFTGNIALKAAEGTANLISELLRNAFRHTPLSRIGALFAMTSLSRLKARIDPRRVNGGVFLGLNGAVVKSHGSADATGVSAAIKLAFQMAQTSFSDRVAEHVANALQDRDTAAEDSSEPGVK